MSGPDSQILGLSLGSSYGSYSFGVLGPGFLNQAPSLSTKAKATIKRPE